MATGDHFFSIKKIRSVYTDLESFTDFEKRFRTDVDRTDFGLRLATYLPRQTPSHRVPFEGRRQPSAADRAENLQTLILRPEIVQCV